HTPPRLPTPSHHTTPLSHPMTLQALLTPRFYSIHISKIRDPFHQFQESHNSGLMV
ncbi:hypothetical protein COCVIDRAFT_87729, partial [Bipolaris victoriae FI3]